MLESTQHPANGSDLAAELRNYIAATLHRPVRLSRWAGSAGLPTFLTHRYALFNGRIADQPCLFALDQDTADATPAEIAKHISHLGSDFAGNVVYVARRLSSDRRARLIGHGVPFVIPGNQLYVPQLAIDLREHFRARSKRSAEQLSPVAQTILFHHLLGLDEGHNTPSRLATVLKYSAMSIGRGFEELQMHKLAVVVQQGRSKVIEFIGDRRDLFSDARTFLRSATRSEIYLASDAELPSKQWAGESALAALTDLSPPRLPAFAIHINSWWDMGKDQSKVPRAKHRDESSTVLELWHYDPKLLSDKPTVDPLSLYAQFWDHADERVSGAAEDLLERLEW